jgi:hypothetical protein
MCKRSCPLPWYTNCSPSTLTHGSLRPSTSCGAAFFGRDEKTRKVAAVLLLGDWFVNQNTSVAWVCTISGG